MQLIKTHYSLAEAAELAKCKPGDLLHQGVQRNIKPSHKSNHQKCSHFISPFLRILRSADILKPPHTASPFWVVQPCPLTNLQINTLARHHASL
jgi:hypothetical protein